VDDSVIESREDGTVYICICIKDWVAWMNAEEIYLVYWREGPGYRRFMSILRACHDCIGWLGSKYRQLPA